MRRAPRTRLRAGAEGGPTPPPGGDTLLETVTLDNFSGASRTNPYVSFFRAFESGAVPSGSIVEMRYGGTAITLQQADCRALHADGSLRCAVFSAKVAAGVVPDNTTIDIALYAKTGTWDNSSSIVRTTLTGTPDFKQRVKIGATDYWCKLDNLDTAGTYRERMVGPVCRAWHHYGIFRNGEGAADADQGQFQGHFYSIVWEDGTITSFPYFINGRVEAGSAATVAECEFKNGAASILNYTTSYTCYAHTASFLCSADALPHWSANATFFHARLDATYAYAKKLLPYIHSTATHRANIPIPATLSYNPHTTPASYIGSINQGGGSPWVGIIPTWSANALILNSDTAISAANRKLMLTNNRVNTLAAGVKNAFHVRQESGHPPVLLNNDYTAAGLTAAQPTIGWGAGATYTDTGGAYDGSATDSSHMPSYAQFDSISSGMPWFTDIGVVTAVTVFGWLPPGTGVQARNPIVNSVQYYGSVVSEWANERNAAWLQREWSNLAWQLPTNHPCRGYAVDTVAANFVTTDALMTAPDFPAARAPLGIWFFEYGSVADIASSSFMQTFTLLVMAQCLRRAQATTSNKWLSEHCQKEILGSFAACPYWKLGSYVTAHRTGSAPIISDPIAADWTDIYIGLDGVSISSGITKKLISDSGGVSGSCPVSGIGGGLYTYSGGLYFVRLWHAAMEVAHAAGLPGATTALRDYIRAEETADPVSETVWGSVEQAQWRIRTP